MSARFESYCWQCEVTHPPGTKRCVHCGGRVSARPHPGELEMMRAREEIAAPIGDEEAEAGEAERVPRPFRIGITAVWLLLALVGSLYRVCSGQ